MALQFTTVSNSIAALSVSNLTIKDVDEIPSQGNRRGAILTPLPQYLTDFVVERNSFGGGSYAKMTVTYNVNYRLLFDPLGQDRTNLLKSVPGLLAMVGLILDAVLAIDVITGAIDIAPQSVTNFGVVEDASGNQWFGCDLAFRVQEFVN